MDLSTFAYNMSTSSQGPLGETRPGGAPVPPELEGKTLQPPDEPGEAPEKALSRLLDKQSESKVTPGLDSFGERTHSYLWANVVLADQKAVFLFAGLAATLAFLHEKDITRRWLANPTSWRVEEWLAFLAVAGLVGGAAIALLVVLPRFSGSKRGLVYWQAIAGFEDATSYARHVRGLRAGDLQEAVLGHCFELAKLAERKFRVFHLALWVGAGGLVSTLLSLALF